MQLRKEQEAAKREEEMKQAARGAIGNYAQAKSTKQQNAYNSIMNNLNAGNMAEYDPRQEEAFEVPAGNVNAGQKMYPHTNL